MNVAPHNPDFPSLIAVPAASYVDTLVLSGIDAEKALTQLFVMDVLVKIAVEQAGVKLGFRAPENIFVEDVAETLGDKAWGELFFEDKAIVDKATSILRGEMEPSPIWALTEEAA